jgi:hypothetical protein
MALSITIAGHKPTFDNAEGVGADGAGVRGPHWPSQDRPRRPTLSAASYGNVVLTCGVGNHLGLRGLPGGAEGIRTSDLPGAGTRSPDGGAASGFARLNSEGSRARALASANAMFPHQSGHRTFVGVRVTATTVACSVTFRRRSPSRSSARWTSHGSSLIWS